MIVSVQYSAYRYRLCRRFVSFVTGNFFQEGGGGGVSTVMKRASYAGV